MSALEAINLAQNAVLLALILAAPLLLVGLVIGLMVAVFQATTQINEMTLTFVPKIFGVMLALLFFASWMVIKLTDYTSDLIIRLPELLR